MADNGTFEDIHGSGSGTIQTGPDFGTIIGIDNGLKAVAAQALNGGSGAPNNDVMRAERALSFSVYWDVQEQKYKVHDPTVIFPDGKSTTMEQPTFSAETFLVEITRNSSGVYAAAWKTSTETPSNDRIMAVTVFKLLNSVVTQYHTGVIVVSSAGSGLWRFANGTWSNCKIQVGYNILDVSGSLGNPSAAGSYRIAVNLSDDSVTLEPGSVSDPVNIETNTVYFHVADFQIDNETGQLKQTWSVDAMPVAYKYV